MNIFIGCSSHEEIDDKYKSITKELVKELAKIPNLNLVLGTANDNSGLMKCCYDEFKKNKKEVTGISLSIYKEFKYLEMNQIIEVETTMDRTKEIYKSSDILLFLPGGLGTYSEILSSLTETVEKKDNKMIILYNKDFFFTPIIQELHLLYKKGFITNNINEYCKIESEIDNILELIKKEREIIWEN